MGHRDRLQLLSPDSGGFVTKTKFRAPGQGTLSALIITHFFPIFIPVSCTRQRVSLIFCCLLIFFLGFLLWPQFSVTIFLGHDNNKQDFVWRYAGSWPET